MDSDTITDYQSTLDWLYRQLPMFSSVGAAAYKPGLETSLRLDEHFGHPHRKFKSIHIAGTNGKGSCSHLTASILQAAGYRTGLYTSPHLVDFRERIRVNGEMIPKEAVVNFIRRFRESGYDGKPSFFELTMMMAFDWFAYSEVDVAVIEVGMGGRLDSTNIITPDACAITNISFDHTQFLGKTLPEIAKEKAGIIKFGIPVVIGEADGEVKRVFIDKAHECEAPIHFAQEENHIKSISEYPDGLHCKSDTEGNFISPLVGDYQRKNIATVMCVLSMLRKQGFRIPATAVRQGFADVVKTTGLRGRWEKLSESPLAICDTGHNQAGLSYNFNRLKRLMDARPGGRLRMVVGFVADKDIDNIIRLFPQDAEYYLTNADIPRALPVERLAEICGASGIKGRIFPNVADAWRAASQEAAANDIIYVGGSTFVVADLLRDI